MNSLYGMMAQKSTKEEIIEDFDTGEFVVKYWDTEEERKEFEHKTTEEQDKIIEERNAESYKKYLSNYNNILPFYWGCWVTSAAMRNLFALSKCIKPADEGGLWLYSDTDSIYALGWDNEKVEEYNNNVKTRIKNAGYGPVVKENREYWPGIAEIDGIYKEFKGLHAKCYAVRKLDNSIKITVAGVPKKAAVCLQNDLDNFADGFIFPGEVSGKLTHYYITRDDIVIDKNGNETGDSVDLHACDYIVGPPKISDLCAFLEREEIKIQVYEEE